MPTILANNWENFFKDHPSNEQSNKTMEALLDGFKTAKSLADCLQFAIEEKETVFIAKAPVTNHIMFLHHFTKIGGTRNMPTPRIFALIGANESAFPGQLNKEILFSTTTTKFAPWASLTAITDADSISAVAVRNNAANKEIRNCIPLPPFMASALIDQGGTSIDDLIVAALTSIKAFDTANEDNPDPNFPKADTVCQPIVNWLFAASRDEDAINPLTATPSIDPIIIECCKDYHSDNIQSSETILNENPNIDNTVALSQIATNVSEQTTVLQKININAEERKNSKMKGITSIHPSFQKMILAASSEDGTDIPSAVGTQCQAFFKQKSAIHAQIHLNQTLHSVYKCSVDVPVSLATALYHGNFLWDRADTPNNFCSLLLGKPSPLTPSGAKEIMMLHLKASKGAGWSDRDLEKAVHQAIAVPKEVDGMLHNINNLASSSELFFGENSIATGGLQSWRPHIANNLIIYESQAASNKEFIAQVLTAIDTRVNCWLEECSMKPIRSNVDDELVCFDDMQRAIKTRQFSYSLPPTIRSHISKPSPREPGNSPRDHQDDDRPTKRAPVHNKHRNARWKLKEGEDYKALFSDKNTDKRPTLDGVHICPRWHIKGVCFTGCNLSSTHVPLTDPATCRKMDTYCSLCHSSGAGVP